MNDFYERFIRMCKIRSVSPSSVCKKIGIGTPNVTYWKKGSVPRIDTIKKIASELNVSMLYFMGDDLESSEEEMVSSLGANSLQNMLKLLGFTVEFYEEDADLFLIDTKRNLGYEIEESELDNLQTEMFDYLKYQVWKVTKGRKAIKGDDPNAKTPGK